MTISYAKWKPRTRILYRGRIGTVADAYIEEGSLHPSDSVPVVFDDEPHLTYLIKEDQLRRAPP